MKWLKAIAKLAAYLALLIVALGIIYGIGSVITGHQLNNRLKALRAKNEPLSLQELAKEQVSVKQNRAPLYKEAYTLLNEPSRKASNKLIDDVSCSLKVKNESDWGKLRTAIKQNQDVSDLLKQAQELPNCQSEIRLSNPNFPTDPAWLGGLRDIGRFLQADAITAAHDGQMDKALESIQAVFHVSDAIADEPFVINQLLHIGLVAMSTESLYETMKYGSYNEAQTRQLYNQLKQLDLDRDHQNGLRGERALGLTLQKDYKSIAIPGWLFNKMQLKYLDVIDQTITSSKLGYREAVSRKLIDLTDKRKRAGIIDALVPVFNGTIEPKDRAKTEINACQILLALQAYKDKVRTYPQDLKQLEAWFGSKMPDDPFSGKSFIYHLKGNGFILYSFGKNLKDDGGLDQKLSRRQYPPKEGDLVWKLDH